MARNARLGAVIGLFVAAILILFNSCGTKTKDFYGEYSIDGRGPAAISIWDDGTADFKFNGYTSVQYEKHGDHLEISETDVYRTFEDPITAVHFELTEDDNLLYILYIDGEVYDQSEWIHIPGTDGETGTKGFGVMAIIAWISVVISIGVFILFAFLLFREWRN